MAVAVMEGGQTYTYQRLLLNAMRALEVLRSAGLRRGTIVGIQTDARFLHLVLILACEIGGAIHVSVARDDLSPGGDIPDRCDILCVETVAEPAAKHPGLIRLPELLERLDRARFTGDAAEILEDSQPPDAIVRIAATSGTTGGRKFMGDTRRSLWHIGRGVRHILRHERERYPFVSIYRFGQRSTYSDTMLALEHGLPVIYSTDRDFLAAIRILPACHTFLMVGDAWRLAGEAARLSERIDTCSLRVIGGPLSRPLRARLITNMTAEVRSSYSSNETSFIALADDDEAATLLPETEIRILDASGQIAKPGEPGAIVVRSPRMTAGYLWNTDADTEYFADGWFRTGDIGLCPEPDKLIVLGRNDDLINLGGLKFSPYPFEERIKSIDGVDEAVLMSFVDAEGIGELHVFVERAGSAMDNEIGARMVAALEGHIARFTAHYCARIPRTATGKPRRTLLREHLEQRIVS
jgi:acyl-coenzyme A synthetase/AMP-(fatty) acid ligase